VRRGLTESDITVKARCQSWIVASMVSRRPNWAWAELPRSRLLELVRHSPRPDARRLTIDATLSL
jgi:hypothetical protein